MASNSSSVKFELKIIGTKNIQTKHKGNLFIRCYLFGGSNNNNDKRIQVNTKEVTSSKKDDYIFWDDTFSLECNGSEDSILDLKEESVYFELRWRNTKGFLGKIGGSQLLAIVEIPWKNVFDAPKMEFQKWAALTVSHEGNKLLKVEDGAKPPALQIAMKVEVSAAATSVLSMEEMRLRRRRERLNELEECGCKSCGACCSSCVDSELIFIGATFDGC